MLTFIYSQSPIDNFQESDNNEQNKAGMNKRIFYFLAKTKLLFQLLGLLKNRLKFNSNKINLLEFHETK